MKDNIFAEFTKKYQDYESRKEKLWKKHFKLEVKEHNSKSLHKVPDQTQKGGYDYFADCQLPNRVNSKLKFEIKEVNDAKRRWQDQVLHNLMNDRNKCDIRLNSTKGKVKVFEGKTVEIQTTNKYN